MSVTNYGNLDDFLYQEIKAENFISGACESSHQMKFKSLARIIDVVRIIILSTHRGKQSYSFVKTISCESWEFLRIVEGLIRNPYENCEVLFVRIGVAVNLKV